MKKSHLTSILTLSLLFFVVASIALAVGPGLVRGEDATETVKSTSSAVRKVLRASEVAGKREEIRSQVQIKACKAREAAINKRSQQIVKQSDNMVTKFDNIFGRVQKFYTEKAIPSGKVVVNYDTLIADIDAKKTLVQAAVKAAEASATAFNCDSDPKSQIVQFQEEIKGVISALKDYRTSIRNLIVAVHTTYNGDEDSAAKSATKSTVKKKATITPTFSTSSGFPEPTVTVTPTVTIVPTTIISGEGTN